MSVLLVFLLVFSIINAQDLGKYKWRLLETQGDVIGRHENAFVEFQDKFYLIGGRGIKPVNVFDPETNTWESKSKSPIELHHFQALVYENSILLVGAMTGPYPNEKPAEHIWMYHPEEDTWEKGPKIPMYIRRGGSGAVIREGKIYIVCGIEYGHTSGTSNSFDSYDLKTRRWESHTKAPHLRDHFSAIVVNNKLYCIGGRNTSIHHKDNFAAYFNATIPYVDEYDFTTDKWLTHKKLLPVPTAAGGVVTIGNCIVYMGGEGEQKKAHSETQYLDLETGVWRQLAPLEIGRHGSNAILYKNKIYFAAGSPNQGGGNMNSIEVFELMEDVEIENLSSDK